MHWARRRWEPAQNSSHPIPWRIRVSVEFHTASRAPAIYLREFPQRQIFANARANQISEDDKWILDMRKKGQFWDPTWWENVGDLPLPIADRAPSKSKLKGTHGGPSLPTPKEAEERERRGVECPSCREIIAGIAHFDPNSFRVDC